MIQQNMLATLLLTYLQSSPFKSFNLFKIMNLVFGDNQDGPLGQLHGVGVPVPYSYGVASKSDLVGSAVGGCGGLAILNVEIHGIIPNSQQVHQSQRS